MIEEVGY